MNTNIDTNGQMNWHIKLRVSASICIALGVLRIIACQLSYVFALYPHRVDGIYLDVFWQVAPFIVTASVLQVFAGICGVRCWGEPKKSIFVAVIASFLVAFDGVIIICTLILWVKQTLFSIETIFSQLPFLPLFLIFVGSIVVFMFAHTAYTYVIRIYTNKHENDNKVL
ncbi:MAG: hypothetical protein FWB80_09615 [Defluviitaleaceae bacterium]|nr:hypothetical protein [Defluviitaleaceae bacterium]